MKKDQLTTPPSLTPKRATRISGEGILLAFFLLASLAFAVHYLIRMGTVHASSAGNVAPPTAAAPRQTTATDDVQTVTPASVSDVVTKALAFKARLSSSQQASLEQDYTSGLAGRWSNLPCGGTCRNGIQLGSLSTAQLAAALEVIKAAAGTAADEGYDEFQQIRMADDVLAQSAGSGGPGGGGYGSGVYFLAFLNTPTTTGAWMLQYGGHHYGANIAYNGGHVVGATPQFEGLEPTSFTVNGTTYTPLAQEHDTMAAMLASLSTEQLAKAELLSTFSDVTMSPGESNGGNGTFPETKVGLAVSSLSDEQKQLIMTAMAPWVHDMDDTVAANLLTIYQSELNGTYIAYTGNGTSGNANSFLNANTNYVRIDGPSVWIEFICQNGVVFSGIHYHSVWRDHVRDYGADLSLTTPLDSTDSSGGSSGGTTAPTITDASVSGKTLYVAGTGFTSGAKVYLNGGKLKKTSNDAANPTTLLVVPKGGKKVAAGETVTLQVVNADGTASASFEFTRPTS